MAPGRAPPQELPAEPPRPPRILLHSPQATLQLDLLPGSRSNVKVTRVGLLGLREPTGADGGLLGVHSGAHLRVSLGASGQGMEDVGVHHQLDVPDDCDTPGHVGCLLYHV